MSHWTDETIDWYAEAHGDDPSVAAVVAAADVPPGAAVLDIGCGTGSALRLLAGRGRRLVGVDPFARMVGHAVRLTPGGGIDYRVGAAEALPLADATRDVVLAINSVHHWTDVAQGMREAFRVLRPDGEIVIGGECFGVLLAEGQDHREALATAGFAAPETSAIPEGFVTRARKPEGHGV